jgi:hypothetical protein
VKLLPDWKWILTRAWSVWAFYAVGALSFIEVVFAANGEALSKTMPAGSYPAIVGIISILGIFFRTVAQKQAEELVEEGEK